MNAPLFLGTKSCLSALLGPLVIWFLPFSFTSNIPEEGLRLSSVKPYNSVATAQSSSTG
jgi:hypothetical protein